MPRKTINLEFNSWQSDYIRYPVERKRIANYGEFRSGKTMASGWKIIDIMHKYPGVNFLITRNTYPQLRDSTIPQFRDIWNLILPGWDFDSHFNQSFRDLKMPGGGVLYMKALDRPDDATKLKNMNIGCAWMEQSEEQPKETFDMIEGRLSQLPNCILCTGNSEGKNWDFFQFFSKPLKMETGSFLPNCPPESTLKPEILDYGFFTGENGPNYVGIIPPPFLNEKNLPTPYYYYDQIMTKSSQYVDKYIYRRFVGNSGLVHPDFIESVHIVRPFDYNLFEDQSGVNVIRYDGMDYGVSNPTCWLIVLYDVTSDEIFVIDEYYAAGGPVYSHAPRINKMHDYYGIPSAIIGCPRAFQTERDAKSPADEYAVNYGLKLNPFPVGIETRSEIVSRRFKQNKIKIFERCVNLRKQIESATWKNIETMENHALEPFQRLVAYIDQRGRRSRLSDLDVSEKATRSITAGILKQEF